MRKLHALGVIVVALVIIAVALWLFLQPHDRETGEAPPPLAAAAVSEVERGRELVLLADCQPCHTELGGAPYAGRLGIPTPFGTFYTPNITPDPETGIGRWSADDFWHAVHDGYSREGQPLYPTFPYTNFTKITRRDADAMFAYLRSVPPVRQQNREHELKFPYNKRWMLYAWRALFFRPGVYEIDQGRSAEWNRGAYLMQGFAHCSACHEARNALGGIQSKDNPSGGLVLNWYAPALTNSREAGLRKWNTADIVRLLKTGQASDTAPSKHTATLGPMADVVYESLQHISEDELRTMAVYLQSLPDTSGLTVAGLLPAAPAVETLEKGRRLYAKNCARCHGDNGEGRPPAAPPLAGNRAVNMDSSVDLIRVVLYGGFPPGTQGNPRPFGMPPFYPTLKSDEVADVLSFVRNSWGNKARPVRVNDVEKGSTGPLW